MRTDPQIKICPTPVLSTIANELRTPLMAANDFTMTRSGKLRGEALAAALETATTCRRSFPDE